MKLAEALQLRADMNRKIEQLKVRIEANALIQEGDETAEDAGELLKELDEIVERLSELMAKINARNCQTMVGDKTLTELIAKRDGLAIRVDAYRKLVNKASQKINRYSSKEIRLLSSVNIKEMQKKVDELSAEIRNTNNKIQETNWLTEL
ncbi:MAG: DIP1984 family protein [Firmicutes bacterium]|nr:DIP1984 family protein [Bacillota bacterium]